MNSHPLTLAVDLGGTRVRAALFSGNEPGPVRTMAHGASRQRPLTIDGLVRWLESVIGDSSLAGIGISIAGTVDGETGVVIVAENLGWTDVPLATALTDAFSLPVQIDTDTFCGAAAEAQFGGTGRGTTLSIAIGTGIGHAWIIDGHVWRGSANAATMFGHLVVDPHGPPCYCGARGCLCQYAAGPVLSPAIGRMVSDPQAAALIETATDALVLAIAHALTLMNPNEVVLGGGAVTDLWPNLTEMSTRVTALIHPQIRPVCLRRSALGELANLLGAALLGTQGTGPLSLTTSRMEER